MEMSAISKKLLAFALLVIIGELSYCIAYDLTRPEVNKESELTKEHDYLLPKSVVPTAYDIKFSEIVFSNFSFKGTVRINARIIEETKKIVLHKGNLTVHVISVMNIQKNERLNVVGTTYNETTEKFSITLDKNLNPSEEIRIQLSFNGTLRNDLIGFYRSSYIDDSGKEIWLAATQFESTHARHAFPCFDEPALKSTFNISIFRPKNYECLSNMISKSVGNWCIFSESVTMSTYLVAFIVSDFRSLAKPDSYIRTWSRPNAIKQTEYSSDIGIAALTYFERLLDEPYILPKLDMVAVPDFSSGAMENWGLITYRESGLLYNENDTSTSTQQEIAAVIAHECTHMWFGNLVTPDWWSYLWLSEGFARYYEYMAMTEIQPNWKMDQQFVVDQQQAAFNNDGVENSVAMTRSAFTQGEIAKMGGIITYSKGASVIHMLKSTFGSEIFNNSLRLYIKNRKYKTATPDDLWKAFQKGIDNAQESKLNVSINTVMKSWTDQPGFPYISVTIKPDYIAFRQERFLLRNPNTIPTDSTWWVPITWTTSSQANSTSHSTKPVYWLSQRNAEVPNENKNDDWLIINVQSAGFYRVQYDKDSWNKIIRVLTSDDFEMIHELNRAAIVDDLLNLARAGLVDYETVFRGLQYLKRETNYLPFKSAFTSLDYLIKKFKGSPHYDIFKEHVISLFTNIYEKVGYDDKPEDDQFTILLRAAINNMACSIEQSECVSTSQKYFNKWKNEQKPIPKNQRAIAYCTAIKYGTTADWEFLWEQYKNSNVASEQITILTALGCSKDIRVLEKYLLSALTSFQTSLIRTQNIASIFNKIQSQSAEGAEFIIDFAQKYHEQFFKYYKKYTEMGNLISSAIQSYPTTTLIEKLENMINRNESFVSSIASTLEKSLKVALYEIDWFTKHHNIILDWIMTNENTTAYFLPNNIIPSAYKIHLTPFIIPNNFTFNGEVSINASVTKDTRKIVLHADELRIKNVTIFHYNEKQNIFTKLAVSNWSTIEKYHFLNVIMQSPIKTGTNISINIVYTGLLNREMRGFYRSSYKINNETRWLAATHLEPVAARRVFPCFDEPALKATFDISLAVPENYNAISNMRLKSKSTDGHIWEFDRTPVMSTYLVAVVVSDFESCTRTVNDRVYGVWSSPAMTNDLSYALEVMPPTVELLESKLRISYGLPKLDMVAVPDFTSGAMENWGLIVYRETNMLYDMGKVASITTKQAIRNVIAHEITHQWFGNLVSPLRWDYLWLSEGFARYFQYHAYTEAESSWNLKLQFVVDHLQTSFSTDASMSTHPVTHKVYTPSEIRSIFDKISYAKAASLIRMIEKLIGPDAFYNSLYNYLQKCRFSTGTPEALFDSFQDEMKADDKYIFNVSKVMNNWTKQSGFPVINIAFKNNIATLTQAKFYSRPVKNETNKFTWILPINWATRSNPNFEDTKEVIWLEKKIKSIEINSTDDWVIFNIQQTGYYRVNYDKTMWRRNIAALNSKERELIHEINRASLIDDMLNLGRAGLLDYEIVFEGLSYLKNETAYGPWKAAYHGLSYLSKRFTGRPEIYKVYRSYLLDLLEPHFKRLGFDDVSGEKYTDTILRKLILEWLCSLDHKVCVYKAQKLFHKEKDKRDYQVPANQRKFVFCTAIRHGTVQDWNYLWDKFKDADFATEKAIILSALACSTEYMHLKKLIYYTIELNSEVRLQDAKRVLTNIVDGSLVGVETVLNFIYSNYTDIQKYFNDDGTVKSIISSISKRLPTEEMVMQFEIFVTNSTKNMPSIGKSLQSLLKRAKFELNWYNEKAPRIFEYLEKNTLESDYRLPTFAKPEIYDIYLRPYFEERNFTFDGNVTINMNIEANTFKIVLNIDNIDVKSVDIVDKSYEIIASVHNVKNQKLNIYFDKLLTVGTNLQLMIEYSGKLEDDMKGFYRSYYIDKQGKKRWLATTQFEPTYARRAFPCFDEPSFKANFTIHIAKPKGYHTLSNMGSSPKERKDDYDRIWDDYETSIFMSSYTLAFVVFDFLKFPEIHSNISVWAQPQLINYMNYSYIMGTKALNALENITSIPYPLKELNFVAVPDFDMGAMENWGLVTYREYGLTYDKLAISASYKRYITTVIAHELTHMWFGNLVTCEWWDYTWLNEGFAEYFSYVIGHLLEPNWELLKQFVVTDLHVGFTVDSTESSHPMNNKIVTPSEAEDGFDKITYAKSASVLRMLDHSLGHQIFIEAVQNYLQNHKYQSARPEYLIAEIQARTDKEEVKLPGNPQVDVTTFISSWTTQSGYPVVNATRSGNTIFLSQERFLFSPSNASERNRTYWVPITYTTESELDFKNTAPRLWLGKQAQQISLPMNDTWYIVNIQEIGFYRVHYDLENWNQLLQLLNSDKFTIIEELNRAQLIDDSLNLARAGYLKFDIALDMSKYLVKETNYLPWKAYFQAMAYLEQRLKSKPDINSLYVRHVLYLLTNIYTKLGFKENMETDSHLDQLNRDQILSRACKYGLDDCIEQSKIYFKTSRVTPNIATAVYCTVVENGTSHDWDMLWDKYDNSILSTDRLAILRGLGCSKNATIVNRYLDLALDIKSKIRKQDIGSTLSSIYMSSQIGLETTLNYFQKNLKKFYDYFGNWDEVGSLLKSMGAYISTEEQIINLEEWGNESDAEHIQSSLKTCIKSAKKNLKWIDTYSAQIHAWLSKNYLGQ